MEAKYMPRFEEIRKKTFFTWIKPRNPTGVVKHHTSGKMYVVGYREGVIDSVLGEHVSTDAKRTRPAEGLPEGHKYVTYAVPREMGGRLTLEGAKTGHHVYRPLPKDEAQKILELLNSEPKKKK